jgi:hypothetical protein
MLGQGPKIRAQGLRKDMNRRRIHHLHHRLLWHLKIVSRVVPCHLTSFPAAWSTHSRESSEFGQCQSQIITIRASRFVERKRKDTLSLQEEEGGSKTAKTLYLHQKAVTNTGVAASLRLSACHARAGTTFCRTLGSRTLGGQERNWLRTLRFLPRQPYDN